jgi:O-antigen ligase
MLKCATSRQQPARLFFALFYFVLAGALAASLMFPFSVLSGLLLLVAVTLCSRAAACWRPSWGLDALVLAWLAWLPLSLFWGMSVGLGLQWVGTLLTLPLAYLAWRQVAPHPLAERGLQFLLWALLLLLALWGILQGPETFTAKPQGPFNDPNTFAGVLNLLALPLLGQYLAKDQTAVPGWSRTLQLSVLGAGALTFFIIASRGATLALFIALLPLLWIARNHVGFARKAILLMVVAGVAYLAAGWVTMGVQNVFMRFVGTLQEGDSSRVMLMRSALAMILENPWLGSGPGSFSLLYPRYRMEQETGTGGGWVHNDYLQLWQEAGIPMLLVLLALVVWVGREIWRMGRGGQVDAGALIRLGYLSGMLAIFIQAATNFMFYFAFVSLLLGLYLGRARHHTPGESQTRAIPRAWRMAVTAYGAVLAYVFAGYFAVDTLLDRDSSALETLAKVVPVSSRYEVAWWLSIIAPFHHSPHQVMGQELFNTLGFMQGEKKVEMMNEALGDMEDSQRLTPCFVPFGTEALNILVLHAQSPLDMARGKRQMEKNLACNPHHGITYYLYGLLLQKNGDQAAAVAVWQSGLPNMVKVSDRLLLAAAIMSRVTAGQEDNLGNLADRMAATIHRMETRPGTPVDQLFWRQAQFQMLSANRPGFMRWVLLREQ